jgi:o-succinylbenzoate---CoA ligase
MALSIFAAAAEVPAQPALVATGRTLNYSGLADRVRSAVGWLRRRGMDGPAPVALDAANTSLTVEMAHALIALGTPVLLLHPQLTGRERRTILEDTGSPPVVDAGWPGDPDARPLPPDPDPPPTDDRPLAIVHTSGSTGRPRGVILSRRAFAASATASAANLGWRDDDRWLLRLPVAHVGGLSILTRSLLARRTVVLAGDARPADLLATIERENVTLASLVPTLLTRLLDLEPPRRPPPSLRAVLLGGAAASPALLARAADRGWPVLTTYGLTEACSQVTTQDYGTVNRGQLGAGRPLPRTEVRIDDDGQILIRGPTLMTGYVSPPGVEAPFVEGGWFPTGDFGRLDDAGNLHVTGRGVHRIVTGGENVDPLEVEQTLERLAGVRQACVFGVPDAEWGHVVCAAIVPDRELDLDLDQLRAEVEGALAPFKRPRRIAVVDELPMLESGKVDREAVARLAAGRLRAL